MALIFVEHQLKFEKGMSFEDVYDHSKDFEKIHVRRVLNKLVKNNLLLEDSIDDKIYYYAPIP